MRNIEELEHDSFDDEAIALIAKREGDKPERHPNEARDRMLDRYERNKQQKQQSRPALIFAGMTDEQKHEAMLKQRYGYTEVEEIQYGEGWCVEDNPEVWRNAEA